MNITTQNGDSSTETTDYIEFNGEKYTEYIEVNGEKIPEFPERLESAESYRNVCDIGRFLGDDIGDSFYSSAVFNEDDERFPNEAIGQSEDSDLDEEKAISPGHYWYRLVGNYKARQPFKDQFHKECEKRDLPANLEVYKKNFPVAIDMESGEEYTIVQESDDEWNNLQVSPEWMEKYDGMPPVVMEEIEPEPEESDDDIPDEEWAKLNSDSKRVKLALDSKPELLDLDMPDLIATLQNLPDMTTGESNIRKQINDYMDSDDDSEMVEITKERLAELESCEKIINEMAKLA